MRKIVLTLVVLPAVFLIGWQIGVHQEKPNRLESYWDIERVEPLVDTSDWATCNNTVQGYTFKYPKEWNVYGTQGQSNDLYNHSIATSSTCEGPNVWVSKTPPYTDIIDNPPSDDGFRISSRQFSLSGSIILNTVLAQNPDGNITNKSLLDAWTLETSRKFIQLHDPVMVLSRPARAIDDPTVAVPSVTTANKGIYYRFHTTGAVPPELYLTILSTFRFTQSD